MSSTWERAPEARREVRNVKWDFTGDVVLITGAARGQGRSHALAFAGAGADLVLCDLPDGARVPGVTYELGGRSALDAVAEECRGLGVRVLPVTCDASEAGQVQAMVDSAIAEYGRIDVLVNNAGISGYHEVVDMPEDEWDAMLGSDLRTVFVCSKYVAREMIKARRGTIVNTASVMAFAGVPGSAHYVAAKHGVAGLSKALAIELAPHGITVNYVCPTAVNTPMADIVFAEHVPENHAERLGAISGSWNMLEEDQSPIDPMEVSLGVLFLASDAAKYITGSPLFIDGGFMAK